MGTRRKSRELALQMLFQSDMGKQDADFVQRTFWVERSEMVGDEVRDFADNLFRVALERAGDIERLIEQHSSWRMERMAAIDRNLLRTAVAEFLAYPERPKVIIINEAIEIAHKFSAPESVNFINGVLDSVARDLEQQSR